jgi:hypothetical protein
MTPPADTNELGYLRPPADSRARPVQASDNAGHMARILQAGAHVHDRARYVPDRRVSRGVWRTFTERAKCYRAATMLATTLVTLIPKLIVRVRFPSPAQTQSPAPPRTQGQWVRPTRLSSPLLSSPLLSSPLLSSPLDEPMRQRLKDVFNTRAARLGTLNELTKLGPVPIIADALGYQPSTIERHAIESASAYAQYIAAVRQA